MQYISEAVTLWHSPEKVWSLIHPAENAPLLSADILKGYKVPGTPQGVGERQAFLYLTGQTIVTEVVESLKPFRAVSQVISPASLEMGRSTYTLQPVTDGCGLSITYQFDSRIGALSAER